MTKRRSINALRDKDLLVYANIWRKNVILHNKTKIFLSVKVKFVNRYLKLLTVVHETFTFASKTKHVFLYMC